MNRRTAAVLGAACLLTAAIAAADELTEDCGRGAVNGGVEACERAVTAHPEDTKVLGNLALARFTSGAYMEGIRTYEQVVEATPNDPIAHYDLGVALATLNMNLEAEAPLRRAVELKTDYVAAWQVLAIVRELRGDFAGALRATLAAAELGAVGQMYDAGEMYAAGLGAPADPALAITWITRAAERDHIGAMRRLAEIYLDGDLGVTPDSDRAIVWLRRIRAENERLDREALQPR